MDVKKSPKASLEDKKSIYLLMGFVAVLSLLYIGFEWTKHEVTVYEDTTTEVIEEEEIEIIQTAEVLPPPPPPDVPEVIEILNVVEDDVETAEIEIDTEDEDDKAVVIQAPVSTSGTAVEEDTEVVFVVVESMPAFPGGDAALFKYLNDNIKYPVIAQESGIQGRVICQFVVNRDGSIVDIEVVRSVDKSLDAEAIRVIKNMPRWTPGKQRGKTVRVKYTLPVNFRLQ
jgi:protein TonB